jgi:hypothetical protein
MKSTLKQLAALLLFTLVCSTLVAAETSGDKPYKIASSYFIVLSPVAPIANTKLPIDVCTVVAESGDWIKVEFTTSKPARSKSDPGKIEQIQTLHSAWLNLDYVVAFVEPEAAAKQ